MYPDWVEDRFGDDIPDWAEEFTFNFTCRSSSVGRAPDL